MAVLTRADGNLPPADFLARFGGDGHLLRELVGLFNADCPRRLKEIREAIADGNAPRLRLAAHVVRGSASSFGTSPAYLAAGELETMAASGVLHGAESGYAALEATIRRLQLKLDEILRESA